nr:hypothetical protein BaRGS_014649 [Batillaria attramentaria]
MPTEIADLRFHFNFSSEHACRLLRFVTMFCAIASNFVLVVIAVDRWGAALSVLAALLSSWPLLVLTGLRTAETRVEGLYGQDCSFSDKFKDTKYPLAFNVTLGVGFILMTFTLAGCTSGSGDTLARTRGSSEN